MGDTVKRKKRWFLKAELLTLFCLLIIWVVDLKTDCVPRAAAGAIRQVVKVAPNWENGHGILGWVYLSCRNHEKANEAWDKADMIACKRDVGANPNDAQAHFDLARSYHYGEEDNIEQAIEHYKAAVRIEPNWAGAWIFLGEAYEDVGHYHKAMEAYQEAVLIDPEELSTCGGLARVCQKVINTDPENADAHLLLGNAYYNSNRPEEAVEAYKQAIEIDADMAQAHYKLGKVYLKMGNKDLALEEYEILKTLDKELANELFEMLTNNCQLE